MQHSFKKNLIMSINRLSRLPITFTKVSDKVKFPAKLKGTIIEKWAGYWKNLFIDYRQMLQDLRTDIQDDPRKALKWTIGLTTVYALAKNNPDELDFKDRLRKTHNEIALVSEDCLNPKSYAHLRHLETCYNQGTIHYKSFGIASVMYTSDISDSCDMYKAHCSYMQPSILSFPSRIVDFGFMGNWWNMYIKMTNYDINF